MAKLKIAVLAGGLSNERDVSLASGEAVLSALERLGHNAYLIDVGRDLPQKLAEQKPDLAFVALHGEYGEDGCVQGLLELVDIPYTGSGVTASAVAMDKPLSKMIAKQCDVPTPKWDVAGSVAEIEKCAQEIGLPVVIKPANGGSSIGISICKNSAEVSVGAKISLEQESVALVEQFIDGPLLTAGIVGDISLPVIQIDAGNGFYDFAHKYTKGTTSYHLPPKVDKTIVEKVSGWARQLHKTIGCRGMSRSEFMCDKNGTAYFLEINTIPGMTGTSLLPKGAMAAGLDFDRLVERIVAEVSL